MMLVSGAPDQPSGRAGRQLALVPGLRISANLSRVALGVGAWTGSADRRCAGAAGWRVDIRIIPLL